MMNGIKKIAESVGSELKHRLPKQRKTQRTKLALLVSTMLEVRSANLMDLAAGLPRDADRTDMRYQWIIRLLGDRFYGTADLIGWCQGRGWDYRLRLKGNLVVFDATGKTTTGQCASDRVYYLEDVELTGRRARTHIGIIQDPGHAEPWIIAMSEKPGYLRTLEYAGRWGIEPMFSDFKSRGFGIEDTQLRYPDRLILVMALALYIAVSTGQAVQHP